MKIEHFTVLIAGGTGLIGRRMTILLRERGHQVRILTRNPKTDDQFKWNSAKGEIDPAALDGVDVVVNLAGEGIADWLWTKKRKEAIVKSRVEATTTLVKALANGKHPIKAFIQASASGFYGNPGKEMVDENSKPQPGDFLSDTCVAWENAFHQIELPNVRKVVLRIGIVMTKEGGALAKMLPTYKLGFGVRFGDGQQFYPWIHTEDVCGVFIHAIENSQMEGTYNANHPKPLTQEEVARQIAISLGKTPRLIPAPAFMLKLTMGEMSAILLYSCNSSAKKIVDTGYQFKYDKVEV